MTATVLRPEAFRGAIVVMGVTGCGKTTVGGSLAARLGVPFIEGDKLHPASNIAKMSAGKPLTDEDRLPWLAEIGGRLRGDGGIIASCSALKRTYRRKLEEAAERSLLFLFLNGSRELLETRLKARQGHFMPPALLASQLATLEPPDPNEHAMTIDIMLTPDEIVTEAVALLMAGGPSSHQLTP